MNTFRINSNLTSLLAYRNLSKSQFNLQTTLERLSSGLRINKAADDSVGSAISTRMNNQIESMKQANQNAQQTNNLIQTAESGLSDISGMLTRMRKLATQAATDTINDSDRASINLEFQTLKNEINRVAHATEYNEMNLLNGTDYKNEVHRANTTADDVIGISVKNANLSHDIRKGIYTLRDEHTDVSGLADISKLSETAITGIRYSSSSLQPALGETYSINSQVNSGLADIDNLSITDVSQLSHSISPIVLPGDHTIISRLDASDPANISRLSGTSITEIRHNASSVVQPGDHAIISRLDASDPANISGLLGTSITEIRHNASAVVQLGDHTISTRLDASDPANISGLSGTSITEIQHDASAVVQPGEHTVIANLNASDPANISGLAGTAVTEIRHNASSVVQPGEHTVIANLNASDPANISGLAGAAITEIRHDASSVIQPGDYALSAKVNAGTTSISNMSDTIIDHGNSPSTQLGDYTVSAKVKSGNADISNLSGTSINQISHDASVQPGNYSLSVVETQVSTGYALQLDGSNDYVQAARLQFTTRYVLLWLG
jgi:flagellin